MLFILIDLGGVYMPYANRVWYISEFFREISIELKNQNHIETLSINMNTINNWFNRMEKENIHFLHRDKHDIKIYDDTDLKIACYLYIETKIKKVPISLVFKFKFNNVKTRTYDEAKLSILDTNKEAGNLDLPGDYSVKSPSKKEPPVLVNKNDPNLKQDDSLELSQMLKKDITYNGHKLTSNEKQRIVDFLSGLVCPINYL